MAIPSFVPQPQTPSPREPYREGVKVIEQVPGPNGIVRVTFALPGLRTAVVAVPESSWLQGDHLLIGHYLANTLLPVVVPPYPAAVHSEPDNGD